MNKDAIIGCLLGTAVGDALGLPYEGMSATRGVRVFPETSRHHLLFGKGMVSDDTEHACFVAQALIRSKGDVDKFQRQLARSLRWWVVALPAGVGFATARSIIKLWCGISPQRSGVFSAGNGPSMRSSVLGVAFGNVPEKLQLYVKRSTEITHSDPKAYYAALAVALAAHYNLRIELPSAIDYLQELESLLPDDAHDFLELAHSAAASATSDEPVAQFAKKIGSKNGISGYSYHTVPCVLQAWLRHGEDFESGLQEIIRAGGDTDTVGAIYGGVVGARIGKQGIPKDWIDNIIEWPKSIAWIERLGCAVVDGEPKSPRYFRLGILFRNLFFLIVVLLHGFRRLLPPY